MFEIYLDKVRDLGIAFPDKMGILINFLQYFIIINFLWIIKFKR